MKYHEEAIPEDKMEKAKKWRANLVEKCAEQDDVLLQKFLDNGDLTEEEIGAILRKATIARRVVPVYCGSAFKNKGIQRLLDGVVRCLPAPNEIPPIICAKKAEANMRNPSDDDPLSAVAFKIMADKHMGKLTYIRIYSGTLSQGDTVYNSTRDKNQRIGRILRMHANRQEPIEKAFCGDIVAVVGMSDTKTGDTICHEDHPIHPGSHRVSGPRRVHQHRAREHGRQRAAGRGPAPAGRRRPDVHGFVRPGNQRDDHLRHGRTSPGNHRGPAQARVQRLRQSGPAGSGVPRNHHGCHGRRGQVHQAVRRPRPVWPRLPAARTAAMPAADSSLSTTSSAAVSRRTSSRPSRKALSRPWRTARLRDIPWWTCASRCIDGSYHDVDSSDIAFQEAARIAFKQLFLKGQPELIEPVMSLEVVTPEDFMGPVTSSICQRRGRIESMERKGETQIVNGMVPLAEMFGYANALRTLTQGRANFSMHFEHYEAVPDALAEEIVKKRKAENKVR